MKMKKWVILLVCVVLLCGAVVTCIAIVSAQGDSEPEASASESDGLQAECDESTDAGDGTPSEVELTAPAPQTPAVITLSHMKGLTGAEKSSKELTKAAVELYAGQDTKYRVEFYMSYWEDDAIKDEFYQKLRSASFGTVYYATIVLPVEGYPDFMYAELTEEALREILSYEMTTVDLIDEFPEAIELYVSGDAPSDSETAPEQ